MTTWPWRQSDGNLCRGGKGLETPLLTLTRFFPPRELLSVRTHSAAAEDFMGTAGPARPPGVSASFRGPGFSGIKCHGRGKHVTSSSPKGSSQAGLFVLISSASAASAHSRLTMNPAPGKSDLRFKWIFIHQHRCHLEIITKDGSYVFNKWPRWKLLSRKDIQSSRHVPFRFISTPPPWFITLSFNPFSLEIKVSSCLRTSFRFPALLANYSIHLLQNYFTRSPAYSWCPNITCFPVPALLAVQCQHTRLWTDFSVP